MTGVQVGEPDTDRWQPVDTGRQEEDVEVAPPVADEVTPPAPTPASPRSATPAPATDTTTPDTSATATVTPAGHMLIGATATTATPVAVAVTKPIDTDTRSATATDTGQTRDGGATTRSSATSGKQRHTTDTATAPQHQPASPVPTRTSATTNRRKEPS